MNEDKDIHRFFEPLAHVELSAAEKQSIRARLAAHMAPQTAHPLPSPFGYFFVRTAPFVASLLVVVLTTSSVAAAEGALPGDVLYPVKVYVNEEVRAAFLATPEARAAWAIERAERRIAEAESLALTDRLTDEMVEDISARIDTQVALAEAVRAEAPAQVARERADAIEARIDVVRMARARIVDRRIARLATAPAAAAVRAVPPRTETPAETPEAAIAMMDASPALMAASMPDEEPGAASRAPTGGVAEVLPPPVPEENKNAIRMLEVATTSVQPRDRESRPRIEALRDALQRRFEIVEKIRAYKDNAEAQLLIEKARALEEDALDAYEDGKAEDVGRLYREAIELLLDATDILQQAPEHLPVEQLPLEDPKTLLR